ncbi:MAG TPA: methyltransferase domain-containing protein [Bryobacteraceae bacterium]|nr:methyltransferase domain-containing protein [Bryobacteraceae bacterium]
MPDLLAGEEREFYDAHYQAYLDLPDSDLVCNRHVLEADLRNSLKPIYERRAVYQAALDYLLNQPLAGSAVLDYGCGTGDWGLMLAGEGASVVLLDLSPVAIQLVLRRAVASGIADRVRGVARDASDLSCFGDGEFDLIFGSFALHHTLKYGEARRELLRVLKSGGRLVLVETYGNNPLLNAARIFRRWISREAVEQGEGIILNDSDLDALRAGLASLEVYPLNLLAMMKRLFRGHFHRRWVKAALQFLESIDRVILMVLPVCRRYCGEALIVGRK